MTSNRRVELIQAAQASDIARIVEVTGKTKSEHSELTDALAELSKSQLEEFWEHLHSICTMTLLREEEESDEVEESIHTVLKCVSTLALSTLSALQVNKDSDEGETVVGAPQPLQEVTMVLHGVLLTLKDEWQPLKNQMCRLFETWWIQQLDGKEDFVPNTVLYLLTRCTEPNSSQNDVSRMWGIHAMLELVDFSSSNANPLILLLQQCCHHPQFISNPQGSKFLAFILSLHGDLTESLHQTIRNHLPATPKSWHAKYGEIYLRAWQKASDDMRKNIEENCIQDLMYRAIHADRSGKGALSFTLFRLLSLLHKQKTQRGVEAMLVRLYEPILWRSLRVANSDVRLNAAALMFDVFPLQDPSLLHEDADVALQRQFDIMHSLMTDPVPEVRVRAILGIGNVLNLYWELIPIQVIQCFVTTLIQDLIHDITSPSVREAVIKVMFILCDNHLCITLLKKILPEIRNLVHDTSEKVRVAMFDLLLKVKGLRSVKFWSIVPVEHILARLEMDSPPVVRRIMKLISPSFVPINEPPPQQVERCLALISCNRAAARQFFLHLPEILGVEDTSKYILVLCRYALESSRHIMKSQSSQLQKEDKSKEEEDSDDMSTVKKSKVKRSSGKKKGYLSEGVHKDKEDNIDSGDTIDGSIETDSDSHESVTEQTGSEEAAATGELFTNIDMIPGLMEGVYLMFADISPKLSSAEHSVLREGLSKKLSITVRELMNMSCDKDLDNALIALAGYLPSRALPMLSQKLMKRIKQATHDDDQFTLAIKSLTQWGCASDVIDLIQEVLVGEFHEEKSREKRPTGEKNVKKTVTFTSVRSELEFDQAVKIIVTMLSLAECRLVLKKKHKGSLRSLLDNLRCVSGFLKSQLSDDKLDSDEDDVNILKWNNGLQAFSVYLRVSAFLYTSDIDKKEDDGQYLMHAIGLVQDVAIPSLVRNEGEISQKMACQVIEKVIKTSSGLFMVGVFTPQSLNQSVEICSAILKMPHKLLPSLIQSTLSLIYQITQLRLDTDTEVDVEKSNNLSAAVNKEEIALTCLTEALKSVSLLEKVDGQVDSISNDNCLVMSEIVQALITPRTTPSVREKTLTLMAGCLIPYLRVCCKQNLVDCDGEKLPSLITSVIATMKRKAANRSSFIEEMIHHLESDAVDIYSIYGIVAIVHKLRHKDLKAPVDVALERAVQEAISKVSEGSVDEDVFRDLKVQVEKKIKSWMNTDQIPVGDD